MALGEVRLAGVPLIPLNETIGYIASYASGDVAVIILIFFTLKCLEHVIKWHLMVTMFFFLLPECFTKHEALGCCD